MASSIALTWAVYAWVFESMSTISSGWYTIASPLTDSWPNGHIHLCILNGLQDHFRLIAVGTVQPHPLCQLGQDLLLVILSPHLDRCCRLTCMSRVTLASCTLQFGKIAS